MKETLFFSVIFPIYNVDRFLAKAIEAIEGQTYKNFELILVDDASTDDSSRICDTYNKMFTNIICLHQPQNEGVSAARNLGIEKAKGDYILFLDPDDIYEPNLIEKVAASLIEQPVDVLVYGLTEDYYSPLGKLEYSVEHFLPAAYLTNQKDIHKLVVEMERETMYGYPWNKAFSASYLYECGAAFEPVFHIEDILFNIAFFQNVTSVTVIEDRLYHYRNQGQSRLTGQYIPDYFALQKRRITSIIGQQQSWGDVDEEVYDCMGAVYFRSLLSYIQRELAHGTRKRDVIAMAKKEMEDDLYLQLKDYAPTTGRMGSIMYGPLANGKVKRAVTIARGISVIRRFFPVMFARLKQTR